MCNITTASVFIIYFCTFSLYLLIFDNLLLFIKYKVTSDLPHNLDEIDQISYHDKERKGGDNKLWFHFRLEYLFKFHFLYLIYEMIVFSCLPNFSHHNCPIPM